MEIPAFEEQYMENQNTDTNQGLFINNYDEQMRFFAEHCVYENKNLNVEEVINGVALPPIKVKDIFQLVGGIYDINTKATGFDLFPFLNIDYEKYNIEKMEYRDEVVVFGGYLHWFFAYLIYISLAERLWYICDKLPFKGKIIFLSFGNQLNALQKELLKSIGIAEENIMLITKPTRFKKIIVPEPSITLDIKTHTVYYTDEYLYSFNAILKNIKPSEHKKVYLTKTSHKKYGDLNVVTGEEYFEDFYRKKGFYVVAPEKLPIKEQLSIISGADEIVGIVGTQMIFAAAIARPETKIVCLAKNNEADFTEVYWHLCTQKNLKFVLVDVSVNFLLPTSNDRAVYLVGISDCWRKYVEAVYGEIISETETETVTLNRYAIEYIRRWCRLYSEISPKCFGLIDYTEPIDFLENMHKVLFGAGLDKTRFNITPSKKQLLTENADLKKQFNALSSEKNLLIKEKNELQQKISSIEEKIKKMI